MRNLERLAEKAIRAGVVYTFLIFTYLFLREIAGAVAGGTGR